MKIFKKPDPTFFIRLQIRKQGEETQYISLIETDLIKTEIFLKELIKKNANTFDPFCTTKKVSIDMREALGTKNLKSKSISFFGFTTQKVYELINKNLS
jgi:hypothetical protein